MNDNALKQKRFFLILCIDYVEMPDLTLTMMVKKFELVLDQDVTRKQYFTALNSKIVVSKVKS